MGFSIIHKGIITAVGNDTVTVNITPANNDCSGCAIAAMCNKGENITLNYPHPSNDLLGRKVELRVTQRSRVNAILLMLVIPIVLLVSVLAVAVGLGCTELFASLISLASVPIWYFMLFILKKRRPDSHSPVSLILE